MSDNLTTPRPVEIARSFRKTSVGVLGEITSVVASFLAVIAPLGLPLVPVTILGYSLYKLLKDANIPDQIAIVAAALTAICFEGIGLIAARSKELHLDYSRNKVKTDKELDVQAVLSNPWIYATIGCIITAIVGLTHIETWTGRELISQLLVITLESSIFFIVVFANRVVTQFENVIIWQTAYIDRKAKQAAAREARSEVRKAKDEYNKIVARINEAKAELAQVLSQMQAVKAQIIAHQTLTEREVQILVMSQEGITVEDQANKLNVSDKTVKNTRAELRQNGLLA